MLLILVLSTLQLTHLCAASPKRPISVPPKNPVVGTQDSSCKNATTATHDTSCWAALGLNDWFNDWKNSCRGPMGCGCDTSQPWSDCVLQKYQSALGAPPKPGARPSCVDLTRKDLCQLPAGDWTKLSDSELATAYASIAIGSEM